MENFMIPKGAELFINDEKVGFVKEGMFADCPLSSKYFEFTNQEVLNKYNPVELFSLLECRFDNKSIKVWGNS